MSSKELFSATRQILDLATHLTGAENCSLMMLNGQGGLYVLNARGLREANLKATQIKLGEGIAGQVARNGDPLFVEDIASDQRFSIYRRNRYRTGSFIACPITTKEKVIGVLNLNDKVTDEPFTPEDFDQAKLISTIAAFALRSFLEGCGVTDMQGFDIDGIYKRLVEAECSGREFVEQISREIRIPLNNIKGAVYYLKTSEVPDGSRQHEFFDIIEKEVNYMISSLEEGARDYDRLKNQMLNIEEREKYKHLLE